MRNGGGGDARWPFLAYELCVFKIMTFTRPDMTFEASEYLLIMLLNISCKFPLICYITRLYYLTTLKYKRFQKSPCVFRVVTFKTLEMTFRSSEKNDTSFYFVQY